MSRVFTGGEIALYLTMGTSILTPTAVENFCRNRTAIRRNGEGERGRCV